MPFFTLVRCAAEATFMALGGLPKMLRKRGHVRRAISDREFLELLERFRIPLRDLVFQTSARQAAQQSGGGVS